MRVSYSILRNKLFYYSVSIKEIKRDELYYMFPCFYTVRGKLLQCLTCSPSLRYKHPRHVKKLTSGVDTFPRSSLKLSIEESFDC